ncbi:protein kinase domain-containing protein [Mycobacterium sp. 141]|uniref:protein kinase domain-containing protein n=1 Tax=Mycobacterium sp. 141 TaxID=1120797 RepID=UPI00037E441F|nr:protein kinase [Mycobacterium sp. 141]
MADVDPFMTQYAVAGSIPAELAAAGFEDAEEIGRGGFGVVYRCTQPSLDRTVAVKVLTADLDEENCARFYREQRAVGRLTGHPNIVYVLEVGTTDSGHPFLVMPYHPQDSLHTRIRDHGPLPLKDVLRLGVKLAGALDAAHRLGIVHRDVKPGNILLTDYGEPALTDFGIAHVAGGFETATGLVTGSPAFSAPEVIVGRPPSPAADVYGLGATLFAALTGHAAFERRSGEQMVAQFLRITTEPIPNPREHGVPEDVSVIIEQTMSDDPECRPSAAELGRLLRESQRLHGFAVDDMAAHAELGDTTQPDTTWKAESPSSVRPKGNLPAELTNFIGRRQEIAKIKRLLSASRLVTLTGVGGAGKTRLSLRVAADLQRAFPDGVWLVELAELKDEALLAQTIASTLGLHNRSGRLPTPALVEYLSDKNLLLVLDNCEHLRDGCAMVAEAILHGAAGVRILATSRQALGLTGEYIFQIPTMSMPDEVRLPPEELGQYEAVTLFVDRATAVQPEFALTEENAETISRICQRLDGIPLAIELTAVRLRALSPNEILDRLEDRFRLLTAGSPGVLPRHQTLRASIEWSHELCSEQEKLLWVRLSVFSGGFSLSAAEATCSSDELDELDVLGVLATLVDKSIVISEQLDGHQRYRLLETIRQYGLERLRADGDEHVQRRRHRDYFADLVERVRADWLGPEQGRWLNTLHHEHSNLRTAFEFCFTEPDEAATGLRMASALWFFWIASGLTSEGRRWLERGLALDTQPSDIRARALWVTGYLSTLEENIGAARAMLEACTPLAEQLGDTDAAAWAVQLNGMTKMSEGDLPAARHLLAEALDLHRATGSRLGTLDASFYLVGVTTLLGDMKSAMQVCTDAIALCDALGERWMKSYMLWDRALVAWLQGDGERAADSALESLRLAREFSEQWVIAFCLETLAWAAGGEPEPRRAARLLGAADRLWRRIGAPLYGMRHLVSVHNQQQERVQQALGRKAYDAEFESGHQMRTDAAIGYALSERTPSPATAASPRPNDALTRREREVAALIAEGMTNKEIAAKLVIARRTVEAHIEHILGKLGFISRTQIAVWVVEQRGKDPAAP